MTTAPEILEQMEGNLDAIVLGVGSSGTVSGIGKYLDEHAPGVDLILTVVSTRCWVRLKSTGQPGLKAQAQASLKTFGPLKKTFWS